MKMFAQEKVYKLLQDLYKDGKGKVTTSELADKLSISRQVASHYLNRLSEEKKVVKIKTKPVYWKINIEDKKESIKVTNVFENFIGYNGSQRKMVESCIAAVKYPPNGLSILLTGKSGVGKSFLANLIYKYSKEEGIIPDDAPFVILNCADYANNPELLSSILFGHKKGAFTGANENKDGIIQAANGGFLFLDEVHRLSSENQEKLFLFIDSGKYKPVGENKVWRTSKVRFIFATTENPDDVLLDTLKRRIQVSLNISSFKERPLIEKVQLIISAYHDEAIRIKKNLILRGNVISKIISENFEGNMGKIKNIAKLSCAEEYRRQEKQDKIIINVESLEFGIKISEEEESKYGDIEIYWDKPYFINNIIDEDLKYFFINIFQKIISSENNVNEIEKIRINLHKLSKLIINNEYTYSSDIEYIRNKFISLWDKIIIDKYGLVNSKIITNDVFSIYVYLQKNIYINIEGEEEVYSILNKHFHRALYISNRFLELSEDKMNFSNKIFKIILCILLSDYINEKITLKGLLLAHGKSTASSIQSVANKIYENYIFEAIDMPIETTVSEIVNETKKFIKNQDTSKGLILLVDTGSLSKMYSSIKNEIEGELLIINNLTTSIALDIGNKMIQNIMFKDIAQKADENYKISTQYFEGFSQNKNIIISCMSGIGVSEQIKCIMKRYLKSDELDILVVEYREIKQTVKDGSIKKISNTKLIISTIDLPKSILIPSINIYDILDVSGMKKLYRNLTPYINKNDFDEMMEELLKFFSKEGVAEKLTLLNSNVVIKEVEKVVVKYSDYYNINFDGKFKLNLYMHISLMIERILLSNRDSIEYELGDLDEKEEEFFILTKSFFQHIEMKFNIILDNYEISLLYEICKQYI
ncbi:Sigma 54 interacting domain protein [Clostridium sp. DL-VIII]|uniref:sigma 54-interacting transcriptional regulator n=1 Tax=Clostridium sp. DL-VIII TaxID=641107 RepID=UPI00023B0899|nr:sigma 54-interacting transcriptional regulator [Clostridium sp. DL-VIII]EHJ01697.1 Sigma 54 interacting domain protein [Clostridium sp. DL-VIII]